MYQASLAAGLRPDLLGELRAIPQAPKLDVRGRGKERDWRGEDRRRRGPREGGGGGETGKDRKERGGISPPRTFVKVGTYGYRQVCWFVRCDFSKKHESDFHEIWHMFSY